MLDSLNGLGPYLFTYGGTQLFIGFGMVVLLPLLYFKVIKPLVVSGGGRFLAALGVWALIWIIAYGDVLSIAWHAKKLCRAEAGPHVFRTAETDGFLGYGDILVWAPYGFTYVEGQQYGSGAGYFRATMKDGKPSDERIQKPTSQYEFARDSKIVLRSIVRDSEIVRDRRTQEILGEQVSFAIYPGWIDKKFIGLTGFTFIPPICIAPNHKPGPGATSKSQDLIKLVLKPLHKKSGRHNETS